MDDLMPSSRGPILYRFDRAPRLAGLIAGSIGDSEKAPLLQR